jgi:galactose-1-phosphate uridylyltransferase
MEQTATISQIIVDQIVVLDRCNKAIQYSLTDQDKYQQFTNSCYTIKNLTETLVKMHERGIDCCLK